MTIWKTLFTLAMVTTMTVHAGEQAPNFYLKGEEIEELPTSANPIADPDIAQSEPEAEVIRERHENRRVKIEREVIQDAEQNYINHGSWKMWDPDGNVTVEGRHHYNKMQGVWTRIYRTRENALLSSSSPFNQGQLPLVSQANFEDGELNGKWVIYDKNRARLCEWEFERGRRHGTSTWWYPSGGKMREIHYKDGAIHGEFAEWDRTGKQVTSHQYEDGRRLAQKVEYYPNRTKKSEGTVLYPRLVLDKPDDWLECNLATYSQEGSPYKNGVWTSWYPNGQKKMEGTYHQDVPHGEFSWWHENGQKSLLASYRDGKKHGQWVWWHESGQKSIQGQYEVDDPSNKWVWWEASGKVAQRADFSDPNQRQMLAMPQQADAR